VEKSTPKANRGKSAGTAPVESFPIALTTHSTLTVGIWNPVAMEQPDISEDPNKRQEPVKYTLDDNALVIAPSKETLSKLSHRRIEVCTRFDLFDPAVPPTVTRKVVTTACANTDFQFLFTTRNPARLEEFSWGNNIFVGASVGTQKDVEEAERALDEIKGGKRVIVIEQITNNLKFKELSKIDWLVVRNSSGMANPAPESPILKLLLKQAWAADCPIFFENGLAYAPEDVPAIAAPVVTKKDVAKRGKGDE